MTAGAGFAGLHVLADDDPRWERDPVAQAEAACEGGAAVVQLRAKHAGDRQCLDWARTIRQLTRSRGIRFVVNDRFDLALAVEADGVHLGQEDLPPAAVPGFARETLAVGRSTHTREQARAAMDEPVDYIAVGPVFGTTSKDSAFDARGLDHLAAVVRAAGSRPVVAIGGIHGGNVAAVVQTGAAGAAVISAVAAAPEPVAAVRALAAAFGRTTP